ncbi:hypothetical protein [Mesonia maritima]|uniref:Uncharacterized protein n=1 Tax=Mesonia maritima TaxID=1793873 RepID=A0ABU1K9A5_9FLAO|nr:hypothetical protein [Mesonia maritima]MDR6302184.1 hypothetical protein [Mesonia maritima]
MEKENKFLIKESTFNGSNLSFDSDDYISPSDSFVFAIQSKDEINIVHGQVNDYTENIFHILQENHEKETFYIKAIKNLIKQKEYLNLLYQVSNEFISEEEFNLELDKNEEKYLININEKLTSRKLKLLSNIIDNLEEPLSEDEVSEMFSVRTNRIEKLLYNLDKYDESSSR